MTGGVPLESRPEVRIDPSDVGRRVSVRRLDGVADGRPQFRDVIGVLTGWDGAGLTVEPRAGAPIRFAAELLVAGKPVPAFPARRTPPPAVSPIDLQRIAARGWPAVEQEPLGEWTLRASSGFTRRANSVQALGDPGLPVDAALERVRDWYAARSLPAYVEVVSPGSPPELAAELDRLGAALAPTLVRTAPLGDLARAGRPADVRLARTAGPGWLALYRRVGGDPALEAAAAAVLHGGPSVWFAHVPGPDGAPLAIGRMVVDGPWACFGAVEVAPAARRRGLATAVMAQLAGRGAEEGATGGYLQVEADNGGAIALYDRLGFTTSHTYHYARLPQR
ncbi:GNAT family N-acetyltransferase [Streptomyces sp. TLI_171]|uniref:GNAT family N-acetyltransferase n=1 Tax=Streptomyces sp. TLI_171 TaxID=1938859 RepID=UPI000C184044|nr:GNAT family N-acetyltransferase [Streptomyces sp. TLI_171]RKE20977.1 acetyltransferase (GNAT) family protein [Streptomyces sp. TLI_171]